MASVKHRLLRAIDGFNGAHPWNHNAHHHRWILRQLPRRFGSALEVGCGTGDLARLLAARADAVYGIDSDAEIVAVARNLTPTADPVTFSVGDVLSELPPGPHDVITCVAVVHHLPFDEALGMFRQHLAPGGTLVIVGLYDEQTFVDRLLSAVSVPLNLAMGLTKNKGRRTPLPVSMTARTRPATMTFSEVVGQARHALPGVRLRRRLFWRYTLRWRRNGRG